MKAPFQTLFAVLAAAVVFGGSAATVYSDELQTNAPAAAVGMPSPTNAAPLKADPPAAKKAKIKKQLTGAELYSMHCNRCHPERYPTERTAAQWKTIMLHMQVRASIPGQQARLILEYLQENSGR